MLLRHVAKIANNLARPEKVWSCVVFGLLPASSAESALLGNERAERMGRSVGGENLERNGREEMLRSIWCSSQEHIRFFCVKERNR